MNTKLKLRKAHPTDLPEIMAIIHQAQKSLAEQGVAQWQDGYPDEAAILRDMENGYFHVVVEEAESEPNTASYAGWRAREKNGEKVEADEKADDTKGTILGVAALIPDGEPDYKVIYDGAWLGKGNYGYMTVHRVAVAEQEKRKGVASFLLAEAARLAREQGLSALRLDTHRDNKRMQACLERNGLTRCGIIHLGRGNLSPEAAEKASGDIDVDEAYIRLAYEKLLFADEPSHKKGKTCRL